MGDQALADRFEQVRPRLRGVAQRLLGQTGDAEDAVQEAWIRLQRSESDSVENLEGWLTTVVARVCLDTLRARKSRREDLVGDRLPEPVVVFERGGGDPQEEAVLTDAVGLALLVVLERLSPAERIVFVLHDLFGMAYEDIAQVVDRSPNAAKQLAMRARRRVHGAHEGRATDDPTKRAVVTEFLAASRSGDLTRLVELLDPDVVLRADTGPENGGLRVLKGASAVAAQASGFRHLAPSAVMATVNGSLGLVAFQHGRAVSVLSFAVRDDRVSELEIFADPGRLAHLSPPAPIVER